MRKIRSDALWRRLTPEQQQQVQHWFFVENLNYRAVRARLQEEFGITCALSALGTMYRHCQEMRFNEREAILDKLTDVLTERGADLRRIPPESLMDVTGRLLHRALQQGDNVMEIAALTNVMLKGQALETERDRVRLIAERDALRHLRQTTSHPVASPAGNPAHPAPVSDAHER